MKPKRRSIALAFRSTIDDANRYLSDERAEFLINGRLSLMRFPGLGFETLVLIAK
jgi:hypothetical protein